MMRRSSVFLAATLFTFLAHSAGAAPPQSVCLDFEALALGTTYGAPVGQSSGDLAFTSNGVPVSVFKWVSPNGNSFFNRADVVIPPVAFAAGKSIRLNNINLQFDFTALPFRVSAATFRFLDLGGSENLRVNGAFYVGELTSAPSPLGGVAVSVGWSAIPGGKLGTVKLAGTVKNLWIGGQELWIDQVCVYQ
jgi:hypothetical protein